MDSKFDVIEQLVSKHQAQVALLQETHCDLGVKLVLPDFVLAGAILRMHQEAWPRNVCEQEADLKFSGRFSTGSEIDWLCVDISGFKIFNVYKPPPS